jgi:hypothetical protein
MTEPHPYEHPDSDPGTSSGHGSNPPEGPPAWETLAAGHDTAAEPQIDPRLRTGPRLWPRVVGVLILLLGVGGAFVWLDPEPARRAFSGWLPNGAGHDQTEARIKALDARIATLEQRPAVDLTAITGRLDALENRPPAVRQAEQHVDLGPVFARLDALEARGGVPSPGAPDGTSGVASTSPSDGSSVGAPNGTPNGVPIGASPGDASSAIDLGPLLARLDALEKRAAAQTGDPGKMAAISSRVEALSARDPDAALKSRLDAVEKQLTGLAATESKATEAAGHEARLLAAASALALGQKLGSIPGAPPALDRFANVAPPTEAALRLAFPAAEHAALKVSLPDTEGKSFLERIEERLQDVRLITIREGDHVVIGNTTAAILTHARVLLDAGDLNGAARAVSALSGPPAEAMANWLGEAKALLAAREALASLAGNG